jgi:hypothetical protein
MTGSEKPRQTNLEIEGATRMSLHGREEPARSVLQFVQQFRVPIKKPE